MVGMGHWRGVVWCLSALEGEPDEIQEIALMDELYELIPVRVKVCRVLLSLHAQAVTSWTTARTHI
jgi:hypothetical protein